MGKRAKPEVTHENGQGVAVVQLATRVPKALYKTLKLYAVQNDHSISELIAEAIGDLLSKRKVKKAA
jgi:hypothetical protein